jgi:phospho-N-acetylmuramoyl-pentapeptide-transferase
VTLISILLALLLAFAGVVVLGPLYIGLLQRLGFGKRIRADGPEAHHVKAGTPTMGGMLIVVVVMFLAMAMRIEDVYTLTPMLALVGVGILGAVDDFVNVRTGIGMRGRHKLVWQSVVGLLAAFYFWRHFHITELNIPPLGQFEIGKIREIAFPLLGQVEIGAVFFILFVAFVIVGTSNAVNLTDGLDGLASGVLIFSFVAYLLIALVPVPGVPDGRPNLAIFCALVIGALMGFLWFNVHPAQIFIGDSGALSMGATLAVVATITGQLPLLAVIGAVFLAVIMSVVLQVLSFRLRGRRIFRMAPLQHHFELMGWAEEKITVRFWIVGALAGLLGFSLFLASTPGLQ